MSVQQLAEIKNGTLTWNFHKGQLDAWNSNKRFVVIFAGTQGGKTSFGPAWLFREIQLKGPGDYLVVTPTFQILDKKAQPELLRLFRDWLHLGKFVSSPTRKFIFSEEGSKRTFGQNYQPGVPTNIFFGFAANPDSLESATIKGAWLDEAGQKLFKLASWEAIVRRLSLAQGRALITSTPYDLGWLKQKFWDVRYTDPDVEVVNFKSMLNPAFPMEEYLRAQATMPEWKFRMFYEGIPSKPAGLVYDCFDEAQDKIAPFDIPDSWPRYLGLDFGGVNTAGVFYAHNPETDQFYLYREYHAGGRTAKEHATALLNIEPNIKRCVGGSRSEGQWRMEFEAGGLLVLPPDIKEVDVGIARLYGGYKQHRIKVFNTCVGFLEEHMTYSYMLDERDQPTEIIENKSSFHWEDGSRYILSWLLSHIRTPISSEIVREIMQFTGV